MMLTEIGSIAKMLEYTNKYRGMKMESTDLQPFSCFTDGKAFFLEAE